MALQKNIAGKIIVFAFNVTDNIPLAGDAANITCNIRIDGGATSALSTPPTDLGGGSYAFDVSAAQTNGDLISVHPVSGTADIQVIGVPGAIYTDAPNYNELSITAGGTVNADTITVAGVTITSQSGTNLETFLNNGASAATATLGNITTLITGVNVTSLTGISVTAQSGTNFETFFNNGASATSVTVDDALFNGDVNLLSIQGVTLTAQSGTNFETFYNNSASATTKVVDDVGGGSGVDVTSIAGVTVTAQSGTNLEFFFVNGSANTTQIVDDVGGGTAVWTEAEKDLVLDRTNTGIITVVNPVVNAERVDLVQGDDYDAADGREISFTITGIPSAVTVASATFSIRREDTGAVVLDNEPLTVVTPTGTIEVYLELTAAQTALLPTGIELRYDIQATTTTPTSITLAQGDLVVEPDINP